MCDLAPSFFLFFFKEARRTCQNRVAGLVCADDGMQRY